MVAEDYVHRIGRTGRAGATGLAVSLVSHEEAGLLREIDRLLKQDIAVKPVAGFEPSRPLRMDTPVSAVRARNGGGNNASRQRRPHAQAQVQGQKAGGHAQAQKRRGRGNRRPQRSS
jgi:ATP-dependent RNA helicase RhlE